MNLFRRKQEPEPAPICTEQSPLSAALAAVQAADDRIGEVNREFAELVQKNQLLIDRNGQIVAATLRDVADRAELESKVRANLRERDAALGAFYKALSIWSGLKPEGGLHAANH